MAAGWVAGLFTAWLVVMPVSVADRARPRHRPRAGARSDRGRPTIDFGRCRRGAGLALIAGIIVPIGALTAATIWGEFSSHTATNLLVLDIVAGVAALALL